jgi:hypothetical protein
MRKFMCAMMLCVTAVAYAQETKTLEQIEEQLKAAPDDPMLHYRKCQALFAAGKQQEAIDGAKIALGKFIQAENKLSWMLLGSIQTDTYKIDVHYNMGPMERAARMEPPPRIAMTRPYSFRVWSLDEPPKLVRVLDFEIAVLGGKPSTAAIGEMSGGIHSNFGMVEADSDFATVKAAVLSVLKAKEKPPAAP